MRSDKKAERGFFDAICKDNDCTVDMTDVATLGAGWQSSYDLADLLDVVRNWLTNAP